MSYTGTNASYDFDYTDSAGVITTCRIHSDGYPAGAVIYLKKAMFAYKASGKNFLDHYIQVDPETEYRYTIIGHDNVATIFVESKPDTNNSRWKNWPREWLEKIFMVTLERWL